jgi:hypothetical protein
VRGFGGTASCRLIGIVGIDLVALAFARALPVIAMAFAAIAYARDVRGSRFPLFGGCCNGRTRLF